MLAGLGSRLSTLTRAVLPDPFVLAVLLTALTFGLAIWLTPTTPGELVGLWRGVDPATGAENGVWKFLGFAMQMCLILVTGHAVASSRPVAALLAGLARLPRSGAQAAALVALVAGLLGVVNWGLGLVGGAILARDVGRSLVHRGIPAHYPVLAAAGYVGMLVWHGGLSGTAPLKVSNATEIADVLPAGVTMEPIGIDETLLSPLNLVVTGGLLVLAPIVMALLMPRGDRVRSMDHFVAVGRRGAPDTFDPAHEHDDDHDPLADVRQPLVPWLLERTPIVNLALAALIGWWAWRYYVPEEGPTGALALTPNTVNLTMLLLGLVLHGTPASYIRAIDDAARGCAGIILQFPLYAGILGMAYESGLVDRLATGITSVADASTLPALTCVSAAIVNVFVPSGGGQWGIQGAIAVESATAAGVPLPTIVLAVAYGDQLTNMLQPFWALPLLAITGVKARDVIGYTALLMLAAAVWMLGSLLILG